MIKRAVKFAALLIAFLAITAASAYLALTLIIKSEATVIVPELVGKEVVYALELLTGLELDIKVKGSEYSSSIPKHHVIFQQRFAQQWEATTLPSLMPYLLGKMQRLPVIRYCLFYLPKVFVGKAHVAKPSALLSSIADLAINGYGLFEEFYGSVGTP